MPITLVIIKLYQLDLKYKYKVNTRSKYDRFSLFTMRKLIVVKKFDIYRRNILLMVGKNSNFSGDFK